MMTERRFKNEQTAHDQNQQLVLVATAMAPSAPPRPKAPTSPMNTLCRMRVVPEEGHGRAEDRAAENGQFARARNVGYVQVVGENRVAGEVGPGMAKTTALLIKGPDGQAVRASVKLTALAVPTITQAPKGR